MEWEGKQKNVYVRVFRLQCFAQRHTGFQPIIDFTAGEPQAAWLANCTLIDPLPAKRMKHTHRTMLCLDFIFKANNDLKLKITFFVFLIAMHY